eukprot:scaffold18947_cov101-Isochrysis_galbana.AAC.3
MCREADQRPEAAREHHVRLHAPEVAERRVGAAKPPQPQLAANAPGSRGSARSLAWSPHTATCV